MRRECRVTANEDAATEKEACLKEAVHCPSLVPKSQERRQGAATSPPPPTLRRPVADFFTRMEMLSWQCPAVLCMGTAAKDKSWSQDTFFLAGGAGGLPEDPNQGYPTPTTCSLLLPDYCCHFFKSVSMLPWGRELALSSSQSKG